MTRLPFQLLMILLAALSALTLPEAKSGVREFVQGLFVPVALPARAIGRWVNGRLVAAPEADAMSPTAARTIDAVRRQNAELINEVLNLRAQLEDLRRVSALATNVRDMVQPARVLTGPANNRQTLTISTAGLLPVKEGMAVVTPQGFAGQILSVFSGGTARVLLVNDPQSKLAAQFVRLSGTGNGQAMSYKVINTPPFIAEGDGSGMVVKYLPARSVRDVLRVGDTIVLSDSKFPATKNFRLGTVSKIDLPTSDAGHAIVHAEPVADLAKLAEVLVVDK